MTNVVLLLSAGIVAFGCRLSGFVIARRDRSPKGEQFLHLVPIAVFSTLTVSSLFSSSDPLSINLIALAVAGVVMWRIRHFGVAVGVGLGVYWVLMVSIST